MAEVKWIKIVTDIFDDEKILLIETLPEADSVIVIWFKLLCLAGKTNNSGVFIFNGIPYTDTMLSTIFRRKESTVKLALKTFEQFGMIEIINDAITIPNWGKHQNLDQLEAKKEYMRGYMTEYRAKQKAITDGKKPCKTNSKANVSSADKIRIDKIREEGDKNIHRVFSDFAGSDVELLAALKGYADMRNSLTKDKRLKTERQYKILVNKLESLSHDREKQIELIDKATASNWLSFYDSNDRKEKSSKTYGFDDIAKELEGKGL